MVCCRLPQAAATMQDDMSHQCHVDPATYLEQVRAALPGYDELQVRAVEAIPFEPRRVLELGIGTGETTGRLLARFPKAQVMGADASAEMVSRARKLGVEARVARKTWPRGATVRLSGVATTWRWSERSTVDQARAVAKSEKRNRALRQTGIARAAMTRVGLFRRRRSWPASLLCRQRPRKVCLDYAPMTTEDQEAQWQWD